MMIRTPAHGGGPGLAEVGFGPVAPTTWPTFIPVSHRMVMGPRTKARSREVTTAPAARKVMYWKRLKTMWTSANWGRR